MIGFIQSEWIKYRRTLTPWIIVCGPLILALAQAIFNIIAPIGATWEHTWMNVFNWWSVVGIPIGAALLSALSVSYEKRSGAWKVLRVNSFSTNKLYWAKYTILSIQTLFASVFFTIFVFLFNFWQVSGELIILDVLTGSIVAWFSALAQLAIMVWIAHMIGFGGTICVGLAGFVSGVLMAEKSYWIINPWAWPIRALEPIFGFHANGKALENDSPFWDPSVIPIAIFLSIIGVIVFLILGSVWFNRREVR
ncbi:lantibiotic immunity ABC transporter MutE/EpiE family permease subunit [Caldifermentibacillus hisashii]|jgi:lantibiotic protection ABC transporter MutE/EpiE family permease subunit|uniref:lantibiotic immunity ABC transporter MutE/EpiE family permease subunit n=1 Tax=Caldifermentibacillus hisashii TaxID=996558 RepID=UPI0022B9B0F1|nr:lantibiotic immunity ABC transporter MutE/EpiE family permease subunit [Caldifermentibacillus hisashii]